MKIICQLTIILFALAGMAPLWADTPQLKDPGSIASMKPIPVFFADLDNMLNKGKTEEFYQAIAPRTSFDNEQRISQENFKDNIWICYLVAKAPLIEDIYTSPENVENDVITKYLACRRLIKCTWALNKGTFKDKNGGQIRLLIASCHARMINQVKDGFIKPEPRIKEKDDGKMIYIKTKEQARELMKSIRGRSPHEAITSRNYLIKARLESMEKEFVSNLVDLFPGKESFVHQFILQAGYERDEIPDLIDRTVGRDSNTEFLYKKRRK